MVARGHPDPPGVATAGGETVFRAVQRCVDDAVQAIAAARPGLHASLMIPLRPGRLQVMASSSRNTVDDTVISLDRYPELQYILRRRRPLLVEDVASHPATEALRDLLHQVGVRSLAGAPVALPGTLGLIRLVSSGPALTEHDLEALVATARTCRQAFLDHDQPTLLDESPGRLAFEACADAILELGLDGTVTTVIGRVGATLGIPPDALRGQFAAELLPTMAGLLTADSLLAGTAIPGKTTNEPRATLVTADGTIPVSATLLIRADRPFRRWLILNARASTATVQEVIQDLPLPAVVLEGPAARVGHANPQFEQLTGIRGADLIGSDLGSLVPDEGDNARVRHADGRVDPPSAVRALRQRC
jgi:PAS domain-containing protein